MNNHYGDLHDETTVPGFELPKSPDTSYSNMFLGTEELSKEPPLLPPQLQSTLLSNPVAVDSEAPLPQPHNATINHLYIENRDAPRSVVALGVTHRFCSKFVTVVLYKPVQRRVGEGICSSSPVSKWLEVCTCVLDYHFDYIVMPPIGWLGRTSLRDRT